MSTHDVPFEVASAQSAAAGQYRDQPAQRLWAIERPAALSGDVYRFVAAVAVLDVARVYVVMLKSTGLERATEAALRRGRLRSTFERDAARFASLDEALAWADTAKRAWLGRGWIDVPAGDE